MRKSLALIVLAAAVGLPNVAAAKALTFSCQQTSEIVVTVKDDGTTSSVQPKMSRPLPIRIVVQPNFTATGQTKGPAAILEDRGQRKERFEGTIELGKTVDASRGAWRLDLSNNVLRIVDPRDGRGARFMIFRCKNQDSPAVQPRQFTYRCEDSQMVVVIFRDGNPPTVAVEFGNGQRRVLPQKRTGSGVRYADNSYMFWNKGNQAIWKTPQRETTCIIHRK